MVDNIRIAQLKTTQTILLEYIHEYDITAKEATLQQLHERVAKKITDESYTGTIDIGGIDVDDVIEYYNSFRLQNEGKAKMKTMEKFGITNKQMSAILRRDYF